MSKSAIADSRAMQCVQRSAVLKEAVTCAPDLLLILKTAASQGMLYNRWGLYSELKQRASALVGWHAYHPDLRTSEHYEAMMDAIDALLPAELEEVS